MRGSRPVGEGVYVPFVCASLAAAPDVEPDEVETDGRGDDVGLGR